MLALSLTVLACRLPFRIVPNVPTPTPAPASPTPLPPDTAEPVVVTATEAPVDTAVPTEIPTTDPSVTLVPSQFEPVGPDWPVIHISQPGPGSSVASPVEVRGISEPTQHQLLMVEITDENGVVLVEDVTYIDAGLGSSGPYQVSLNFSVSRDQPGRISVYDVSARDGGLSHLASVPVMLLASGEPSLTGSPDPGEAIYISVPNSGAEVNGGALYIEGLSAPYLEGRLETILCGEGEAGGAPHRLCGTDGNIIAQGVAEKLPAEANGYSTFIGALDYSVSAQTRARLVIFTISPRDSGYEHLSTVYFILNP